MHPSRSPMHPSRSPMHASRSPTLMLPGRNPCSNSDCRHAAPRGGHITLPVHQPLPHHPLAPLRHRAVRAVLGAVRARQQGRGERGQPHLPLAAVWTGGTLATLGAQSGRSDGSLHVHTCVHRVCTAYALHVQVRSRPIRWITGVHVAKMCIAGLVAADAAQQAAADPSRPLGGLLLRMLVVWTTLASLVSFAVSWRTDSQADLLTVP